MRLELAVVSFICVVLVLIPLPVYWKARNWTMVALISWMGALNAVQGINMIAWADNVEVKYVVWCDITTNLWTGSGIAVPALQACFCRSLVRVASGKDVVSSAPEERQHAVLALFAGVVLPVIYMALHYVVQPSRFDILEDFGCRPMTYFCVPSLFLVFLPPILLSLVGLIYAGLGLMYLMRRRRDILRGQRSQRDLTLGTHARLVAFSVAQMIFSQTITIWFLIVNLENVELGPWISWEHVHAGLSEIPQTLQADLAPGTEKYFLMGSYLPPFASVMFFAFFGCSRTVWAQCIVAWQGMRGSMSRVQLRSPPAQPLSSSSDIDLAGSTVALPPPAKLTDGTVLTGERGPASSAQVACQPAPPGKLDCARSLTRAGL